MSTLKFNTIVDSNSFGGVNLRTVSGGKLSSTKIDFAGVDSVKGESIEGQRGCKFRETVARLFYLQLRFPFQLKSLHLR